MKHITDEDCTLIDFLATLYPQSSKNKLRKMLTEGRIYHNNQETHKAKTALIKGETIEIKNKSKISDENQLKPEKPNKLKIDIIYEDEDILIIDKPCKKLSIATDKLEQDTIHSLSVDYLREKNKSAWAYIVHRLDKETSGVMILAKNKPAKEYLQEQFANREIHRVYHALIEGKPGNERGTIEQYLVEDKNLNIKSVKKSNQKAKLAITHYEIIGDNEDTSMVKVLIETGRRHQIRMAMKEIQTPIVGDKTHGAQTDPINRICLHASSLEFLHPSTDEPVRFESSIPFKLM